MILEFQNLSFSIFVEWLSLDFNILLTPKGKISFFWAHCNFSHKFAKPSFIRFFSFFWVESVAID